MMTHSNTRLLQLSFLVISAVGISGVVRGQTVQQMPNGRDVLDSSYAGEPSTNAGYNVEVGSLFSYDNNVFNDNKNRQGDEVFREDALFNLWEKKPLWDVAFQYNPTLLLYRKATGFNALNQTLAVNGTFRLTPRFSLLWSDNFTDMTGLYQAASNQFVSLPAGPPPGLNSTPITPLTHELANQTEGHLQYQVSQRGAFDFMGNYALQDFSNAGTVSAAGLFNTKSATGGASYQYRLEQHFTLGARYLYQSFGYGIGTTEKVQSIFATGQWQLGRRVVLSVYGGPQHTVPGGAFPTFAPPGNPWQPAGGGTFTLRSDQTVFEVTGQRLVTNGGGLLTTVTSSYEGADFRRRLTPDWDLIVLGTNGRSVALQGSPGKGIIDTQSVGAAFEHPIRENLNMHFEYDYLRQRINQFVPRSANGDTSEVTFGVFYRFGDHSL